MQRDREPLCTACSHGERTRPIDDPTTIHPPSTRLQSFPTADWSWWLCSHCKSVWVVRALMPGIERRRIGYLDDVTLEWRDVRESPH